MDTSNEVKVKEKSKGPVSKAEAAAAKAEADKSVGRYLTIYTISGNTKAGFAPFAIGFTLGFLVSTHNPIVTPHTGIHTTKNPPKNING